MTRDSVRRVQRRRAELGHYTGAIDGLRGPRPHAAAEAHQHGRGFVPVRKKDKLPGAVIA